MNPAQIILEQLGGNKFIAMTGAKNFMSDNDGYTLVMDLPPNPSKARKLRITLNGMDTYDMIFFNVNAKTLEMVTIVEHKGVYDDMLQPIFIAVTGFDTHL